jgi:aspartyl-tRNA(Asn)/glutamyl-tRNA(Gln) amidotransferase subunit C
MSINNQTIQYLADLARIELNPEELTELSTQLKSILDFVDALKALDVDGIPPTSSVFEVENVLRTDQTKPSLNKEKALKISSHKKNGFFLVPKVLE